MNLSGIGRIVTVMSLATVLLSFSAFSQEDETGKQKLLTDLRSDMSEASAKSGVPADLSPAEAVCNNATATITECRRAARSVKKNHDEAVKVSNETQESESTYVVESGRRVRVPHNPVRKPGQPVRLPSRR